MGFYRANFSLYYEHHLSLTEIENMVPFEREFYISLTNEHIKKEQDRIANLNRGR